MQFEADFCLWKFLTENWVILIERLKISEYYMEVDENH